MATITKLYPLLKEMGLDDNGAREFIEALEDSSFARLEKAVEHLVTKEDIVRIEEKLNRTDEKLKHFATKEDLAREIGKSREDMSSQTGKVREDMALMKAEIIKWNVGTIIAVSGLVTAIVKLVG